MDRRVLVSSYLQSLVWIGILAGTALVTGLIVELVLVDFVHGNPNRPQSNAMSMMLLYSPLAALISLVGVFLVFSLPQCIQALLNFFLAPRTGRSSYLIVLISLPATTVVTWYCFDYLTPSDFNLAINEGPDWTPYQHGITPTRYLSTLVAQALVTGFALLFCLAAERRLKKWIVLSAFMIAFVGGGIQGQRMAEDQFQYLDQPDTR
jgi:hypothetical protein